MSRSEAATALADSAFAFAQEKASTAKPSPTSVDDTGLIYAFALTETLFHFAFSCPLPLEPRARAKVVHVFQITIGDLIDDGLMGWLDETIRRPFVLRCAEYLGAAAFKAGRAGNLVTEQILNDAACAMVHAKQAHCPLKASPSGVRQFGTCCEVLVADLRCNLKTMDAPAPR